MGGPKIDEAGYQEGRRAFEAGGSLRDIIQQIDAIQTEQDDDRIFSGFIGFADAALDKLRSITR